MADIQITPVEACDQMYVQAANCEDDQTRVGLYTPKVCGGELRASQLVYPSGVVTRLVCKKCRRVTRFLTISLSD